MNETGNRQIRYLEEMGLAPVWQLREPSSPAIQAIPEINQDETPTAQPEQKQVVSMQNLDDLAKTIRECNLCRLGKTRTKAVPGVGDQNANWLFIGEGPGYYEDQQGEPFVGRSGKLLDNMLYAIGLKRGNDTYIANIVKCRATDAGGKDRPPVSEETTACLSYLERQIEMINPKIIVTLGKTAAVALLNANPDIALAALRGKVHHYQRNNRKIPVIASYHPAYLLRTPTSKKQAWADLCLAMQTYQNIE